MADLAAKRLLHPHIAVRIVLIPLTAAALAYVFIKKAEAEPIAYAIYLISAYAAAVAVLSVIQLVKNGKKKILKNPYAAKYISDRVFRAELSLIVGTAVNLLYSAFRIVCGLVYQSAWSWAIGVYYVVLCGIRFMLMCGRADEYRGRAAGGWYSCRLCGVLMLLLNAAMAGMAIQMIWQDKSYSYPGSMIFVSAGYAFYSLTMAIINIIKFRRIREPVLTAAKTLNLVGALMSMFALQTAMLVRFGGAAEYRQTANCITGVFVCAAAIAAAVIILVHAQRQIKLTEAAYNERQ